MNCTRSAALVLALFCVAWLADAQTLTGTLTGRITDEHGAVLPGAAVALTGRTGSRTQVTDSAGAYRFLAVPPGLYAVRADLQGFQSKQQDAVAVGIGQILDVSMVLAVGGVAEVVDVVAGRAVTDTSSTATHTQLSQDLLFNMPLSHDKPAVNILQYTPGVSGGSAFGGAASTGNALLLDGVDTRDPAEGTAWTFYNYNIIEEVQAVSLGQPAEYGGFTGAVVNTITKSGGNRFSFLGEYRYSNDSAWLFSDNTDADLIAQNKHFASPARVLSLNDYTVQLGGPLKKDTLFFFASAQRYEMHQKVSGPIRDEVSPRINFKLTAQPTPTQQLTASLQYDQYNTGGGTGLIPGYAVSSQDQTMTGDSPEYIWNAQYRNIVNASTLVEAKLTGYWGYVALNPLSQAETHIDGETGAYWGGAGFASRWDRDRSQFNVAVSKYAQFAGSHTFKFGVEIERSGVRDRFEYVGRGVSFFDYGGQPYLAYGYSYDLEGRNKRESYYAQDQWKIAGRLTANLGARLDRIRGEATSTGQQLYSTRSIGPRLGAAWDVTGKGTSVLKASYGRLYEGAAVVAWGRALPGVTDLIIYEVGPNWGTLTEIDRVPAAQKYSVASGIEHPRADEVSVSWEQAFARSVRVTATGIWRDWHNFVNWVPAGLQWTSGTYTLPAWMSTAPNPIAGTTTVPIYKWANTSSPPQYVITNVDTVDYSIDGQSVTAQGTRRYRGLMFVVERAKRGRWQAQMSWVVSKTEGTVANTAFAGVAGGQFATPNTSLTNAGGPTSLDRRHTLRLFAGYQIPKIEVSVNGFWSYESGAPYAPYVSVPKSATKWTDALNVNVLPRGTFSTERVTQTAVRIEKVVRDGVHRFGVYADIQNLFNQGAVLSNNRRYPSTQLTDDQGKPFNVLVTGPLTQMPGRQITLGARWSF